MKDVCFYAVYDYVFKKTMDGLIKSVMRFYPEIDFIVEEIPRVPGSEFDLRHFCDVHLNVGLKLMEDYKRIISVDPDHIMCNECPDLFGDYDFGFVRNNIPVGSEYGGIDTDIYINAGMTICTNKEVWIEWMKKYSEFCNNRWEELNEQNSLNWIYHYLKHKYNFKLLEFKDKSYGISDNFIYDDMYLENEELTLTNGKKVCMFHAAGTEWKDKATGEYSFNLIKDESARNKLKSLIE